MVKVGLLRRTFTTMLPLSQNLALSGKGDAVRLPVRLIDVLNMPPVATPLGSFHALPAILRLPQAVSEALPASEVAAPVGESPRLAAIANSLLALQTPRSAAEVIEVGLLSEQSSAL